MDLWTKHISFIYNEICVPVAMVLLGTLSNHDTPGRGFLAAICFFFCFRVRRVWPIGKQDGAEYFFEDCLKEEMYINIIDHKSMEYFIDIIIILSR